MNARKRTIGVVAVGNVPELAPKVIAAHVESYLQLPATILTPLAHPAYAFDDLRLQYDAGKILNYFESCSFEHFDKVIGIFSVDLFVPTFTHVFGEARQAGMYALVSLFRLAEGNKGNNPSSSLLFERAAKVALHEIGHLFNLFHCQHRNCLMHYSGGLTDLDECPLYFCRYCSTYFKDELKKT
ncbi:MAG: archaemetzincin family Zn-dependent metalloprotease [Desulfobacterales bacterium]|jgi:archaemetzincin